MLTHADMRATNTFSAPEEVKPGALAVKTSGDAVEVMAPKQSVAAIEMRIA